MYGPESAAVITDNRPNNYTLQGSAVLSGTHGAGQAKGNGLYIYITLTLSFIYFFEVTIVSQHFFV